MWTLHDVYFVDGRFLDVENLDEGDTRKQSIFSGLFKKLLAIVFCSCNKEMEEP